MGGLTIVPDCLVSDMVVSRTSVLLVPGAETWNDPKRSAVIATASEMLSLGATVCAICGATAALAGAGLLDKRPHTSNGVGFLEMVSPTYQGQCFYIYKPSVVDCNPVTAGCTDALLWAKQIIEHLGVFEASTLEAWYEYFFALMQTLPSVNKN